MLKLTAGTFNLTAVVDTVFFIGSHLVALNRSGKLGVWHAVSQNWQVITALFTAHCLGVMIIVISMTMTTYRIYLKTRDPRCKYTGEFEVVFKSIRSHVV